MPKCKGEMNTDHESIEELEELGPEELEGYQDSLPQADFSLVEKPCIRHLRCSHQVTTIPFLITDNKLRILWANNAYKNHLGKYVDLTGDYFTKLFLKEANSSKIDDMYRHITNRKTGYSWKGRLETSSKNYLTLVLNPLIFPIFENRGAHDGEPLGYGILLDDITEENKQQLQNTYLSLLEASKLKDNDTGKHIQRVNEYSRLLSEHIYNDSRFPEVDLEFIDNITFLAAMHDVGKIGTPDDILNKKGPLDEREWMIMQEHTKNGAYILSTYPAAMAREIALSHHERWDGSGYPYRLNGDLIPLSARIVAIADVYDALRMKRTYKDGFSHKKARDVMFRNRGSHFDPRLIDCFANLEGRFEKIYSDLAD